MSAIVNVKMLSFYNNDNVNKITVPVGLYCIIRNQLFPKKLMTRAVEHSIL